MQAVKHRIKDSLCLHTYPGNEIEVEGSPWEGGIRIMMVFIVSKWYNRTTVNVEANTGVLNPWYI